ACGHAAVSAVLRDPRLHVQVPYADAFGLETAHLTSAAMSFANGADHTRRRGFMAKAFQPKVLAELEPRLIELVDELLGALARKRSADFVADLALPFPVRVIAEMLGVPRDAHAQCTEWSEALAPLVDAALTRERFQKVYDAGRDFSAFMLGLMEERRRRPARDIITTLVRALDEQGELTELEGELAGQLGVVGRVVKQLPRLERLQAGELQAPGHEGAHAGGDEHGARQQAQAALRLQQQAAVGLALQALDQLAQVQRRREGRDLRQQRVDQRLAAAHRHGRNVVDRLVGVQRGRLTADMGQDVDDLGAQPQQAELEHREQADRAGADHGDVGFQRRGEVGAGHGRYGKQSDWRRPILRQPAF
ncbi:MAG: cytochrome P450, partial [Burkholderiales bacterium]|nr:cytochrome P450 [Burkholderiales bacterium]